MADLHCTKSDQGRFSGLFHKVAEDIDVLLLGGDLTDYGLPEEARVLAQELKDIRQVRILAVLGNHDFHSEKHSEVSKILTSAGVVLLDGDNVEIRGIGFTGVKGYLGGFDDRMLQSWGEPGVKAIVHEAIEESLKLETGLSRLNTRNRIVLLHYSPVRNTVVGESPEIYAFLGSSRLEEAIHRHCVTAVFHGHAHYGSPEGKTSQNVPVFNVALPLLQRSYPGRLPFRKFEVKVRVEHGR